MRGARRRRQQQGRARHLRRAVAAGVAPRSRSRAFSRQKWQESGSTAAGPLPSSSGDRRWECCVCIPGWRRVCTAQPQQLAGISFSLRRFTACVFGRQQRRQAVGVLWASLGGGVYVRPNRSNLQVHFACRSSRFLIMRRALVLGPLAGKVCFAYDALPGGLPAPRSCERFSTTSCVERWFSVYLLSKFVFRRASVRAFALPGGLPAPMSCERFVFGDITLLYAGPHCSQHASNFGPSATCWPRLCFVVRAPFR